MNKLLDILNEINTVWESLLATMPADEQLELRRKRQQRRLELETQIKKCHSDDNHWPPNSNCPVCQKVFQKLEIEAGRTLREGEKLEDKVKELFEKNYGCTLPVVVEGSEAKCQ